MPVRLLDLHGRASVSSCPTVSGSSSGPRGVSAAFLKVLLQFALMAADTSSDDHQLRVTDEQLDLALFDLVSSGRRA